MVSTETWLPLPGWEGLYEVSSLGRTRSSRRKGTPGKILSPSRLKSGYVAVKLSVNAQTETACLHVMVASAFLGPKPEDRYEVRHLDGNKLNNRADNLAWGTRSENVLDSVRHGTHFQAAKTHCPQGHPYSKENTYRDSRGCRTCRACRAASRIRWKLGKAILAELSGGASSCEDFMKIGAAA